MRFISVHQASAGLTLLCLLTIHAPSVLSAVPQGSLKETAEQEIQRARRDISREDFREAKKALKRALKLNENSSEACLLMAGIHRIEGKKDDAFKYVRKAIASNDQYVEAQTFYAQLLFEAGKLEQAREQLAVALGMTPKDPNAYVLDAEMYIREKKYKEAVASFERAISLAPANDAGTSAAQARVDAIKVYVAFESRQEDDTVRTRPVMKNRPRPNYTEEARRSRTQGLVVLAILVNENGAVSDHIVLSGLAHGLTLEAVRAARMIKFSPALLGGIPVPHWMTIEVEFNLR